MATCLIGIGANLGDRSATLDAAVERLSHDSRVRVLRRSHWLETAAIGGPDSQPEFLNGALVVETNLAPRALLQLLHEVEGTLGRERQGHWHPRTLDLDLLLYDELQIADIDLIVPHPRMAVRRFVLEPAAVVAPDLLHPPTGWTVAQLLAHLNAAHQYAAVTSSDHILATRLALDVASRTGALRIDLEPIATAAASAAGSTPPGWLELARTWARELDLKRWTAAATPGGNSWVVSNRWFVESRLVGDLDRLACDVRSPAAESAAAWQDLNAGIVQPKLILAIEVRASQAGGVDRLPAANEPFAQALATELSRPGQGPVLRLDANNWDRAVIEAIAALAGAT